MANEVEIRITAHDLTGPAFASVMAKIAAMKKAIDDALRPRVLDVDTSKALAKIELLKKEANSISIGKINIPDLNTGLIALRQKLQSLGIADIADIDVQPGRLMTQLQLIKRLINQSGISDVLDFNLTPADLSAQFAKLGHVAYDIPVKFDMSKMPPLGQIGTQHVPIVPNLGRVVGPHMPILNLPANVIVKQFIQHGETMPVLEIPANLDIKNIPKMGETQDILHIPAALDFKGVQTGGEAEAIKKVEDATSGFASAASVLGSNLSKDNQEISPFLANILKMSSGMKEGAQYNAFFASEADYLMRKLLSLGSAMTGPLGSGFNAVKAGASSTGSALTNFILHGNQATTTAKNAGFAFNVWGVNMGARVGGIQLWHVALDGVLESTVALTAALAALAVGGAAMVSTATDIYNHINAVNQVNSALGDQINVLGGQFRTFSEGVLNSSQVLEIYGGLINLVTQRTGGMVSIAHEVVIGFDDWIARINLWSQTQGGANGILQTGVNFLHQFEGIVNNVGVALDNLIKKDPGTAHMLLDIVGGASKLFEEFTKLPAPIVESALALHSMYVWGGFLGGLLAKLPGGLGLLGRAMVTVAHSPALLGLTLVAVQMERAWNSATPSVTKNINDIESALSQMDTGHQILGISSAVNKLTAEMAGLKMSDITSSWTGLNNIWQESDDKLQVIGNDFKGIVQGSVGHQLMSLGNVFKDTFDQGSAESHAASLQMQHDISDYQNEINKLLGDQKNMFIVMGDLTSGQNKFGVATHNAAQSIALMSLAGVQFNDSIPLMLQKVNDLISGYKAMSVQGPLLASAVNAVTFATEQQQSKVGQLTSAYNNWFGTISGGVSSLASFATDMSALDTSYGLSDKNLGSLNSKQAAAQTQFITTAGAAQTQFNSLLTLASAAGLGAKGTGLLTRAMQDYEALLIPAAKGNTGLQSTLVGLAQEVNPNITNFKQLTTWVGNVKHPMDSLDSITKTLTADAGNLATDVQNLATALHQNLDSAMSQVILTETGGLGPMENLYKAIAQTGLNSGSTAKSSLALAEQFTQLTGNVGTAKSEFESFAMGSLHLTQQQADQLWQKDLPGLQNFINGMHGKKLDLNVDDAQALGAINQVQAYLNGLHNRTVYATVVQQVQVENTIPVRGGIGGGALRAMGGIVGAAASGGWRQGLTLVGELGPELVRLPQGSQVYPHGVTPGYASQGGGVSPFPLQLEVSSAGNTAFEQFMVMAIREWVRLKGGGNVQKAFGRNK